MQSLVKWILVNHNHELPIKSDYNIIKVDGKITHVLDYSQNLNFNEFYSQHWYDSKVWEHRNLDKNIKICHLGIPLAPSCPFWFDFHVCILFHHFHLRMTPSVDLTSCISCVVMSLSSQVLEFSHFSLYASPYNGINFIPFIKSY